MSDLLPPNSTPQERALSASVSRIGGVPVPVRDIVSPDNCPSPLLPWLAWALSVDEWDPDWPEERKRAMIAESVKVHMHKGTVGAVRRVLDAVVGGGTIEEWFQYGGSPGYFKVHVTLEHFGMDADTFDRLTTLIEATKNVRSWLEALNVYLVSRGKQYIAVAQTSGEDITVYPYAITELQQGDQLYFAVGYQSVETITVYPQAS